MTTASKIFILLLGNAGGLKTKELRSILYLRAMQEGVMRRQSRLWRVSDEAVVIDDEEKEKNKRRKKRKKEKKRKKRKTLFLYLL